MESFDLVVIGAGPGGYVAAVRAAQLGQRVAVVEEKYVGGSCLNVGCIPSKTFLHHSQLVLNLKEANQLGITNELTEINQEKLVAHKIQVVSGLKKGVKQLFKKNKITLFEGHGEVQQNHQVRVGDETIKGTKILLATGSRPFVPPIAGIEQVDYLTTDEFFDVKELPEKLVIIGGGIIAVEMAFAMAPLGVATTLIEVAPDILMTEDSDVRQVIKKSLKKLGVQVIIQAEISELQPGKVQLKEEAIHFDKLLIAAGRKPNLAVAEALNLQQTEKGFVAVGADYQTSLAGYYAIGDLIEGLMLAHVASEEGILAVENMFTDKSLKALGAIPRCLYSFPEVAAIGPSEEEAQKKYPELEVKKIYFASNGKAIASGETQGFAKIMMEKTYNQVVGAVIVGANATEMIHTLSSLLAAEGTVNELAEVVFAHPSLSEIIGETANGLLGKAIHN